MAMTGATAIAEIQFADYIFPAYDQVSLPLPALALALAVALPAVAVVASLALVVVMGHITLVHYTLQPGIILKPTSLVVQCPMIAYTLF